MALAKTFAAEDIQLFYQIAIHGRGDLGRAPDEYAGFTMTLMRMLAFMPEEFPQTRPPSTPAPAAAINAGGSAADRERGTDAQVKSTPPSATSSGTARPAATSACGGNPRQTADAKPDADTSLLSSDWVAMVPELKLSGLAKDVGPALRSKACGVERNRILRARDAKAPAGQRLPGQGAGRAESSPGKASAGKVLCWDGHGHDPGGTGESARNRRGNPRPSRPWNRIRLCANWWNNLTQK